MTRSVQFFKDSYMSADMSADTLFRNSNFSMKFLKLFLTFSLTQGISLYQKRSVSPDSRFSKILAGYIDDDQNKAQDLLDYSVKNVWTPPVQHDLFRKFLLKSTLERES